ncbi:Gfo/Idh/MocA family oxidoreductase [bacterium]|nr:Gfo/Idh/MocA family oxidoreductase [bacterium]
MAGGGPVRSAAVGAALPIGIVGTGKHGARYLAHALHDVPGLRVAAICRRDEAAGRALAGDLGVRFHRSARELVADPEVRAVVSAAPPSIHEELVGACIRERKPLLVEKPLATSAAAAFRVRDAVIASGLPCMVGHTLRFNGTVERVRELLDRVGPVGQVELTQGFEPSRLDWLDDPSLAGGGNVLHTGVHSFDLLRLLTGREAVEVSCLVERVTTRRTEDSFVAAIRMGPASGPSVLATVAGSRATEGRAGSIRVVARDAQLVADHVHGEVSLLRGRARELDERVPDVPTVLAILRLFPDVAAGRVAPPVDVRDGAAAVAIADACYRSAESGRRVAVRTE